jgi:hypothetical protein
MPVRLEHTVLDIWSQELNLIIVGLGRAAHLTCRVIKRLTVFEEGQNNVFAFLRQLLLTLNKEDHVPSKYRESESPT